MCPSPKHELEWWVVRNGIDNAVACHDRSWSSKAKQMFSCFNIIEISIRLVASWLGIYSIGTKSPFLYQNVWDSCFGFWKGVDNVHTYHLQGVITLLRGAWFFPGGVMTLAHSGQSLHTQWLTDIVVVLTWPVKHSRTRATVFTSPSTVQYCDSEFAHAQLARVSGI